MALGADAEPLIDPEVKAFVYSLASALGGSSAGDDGRYVLGDDALAVLRDIKRWLRLYDDKLHRLDVARLLSDANLVKNDLLEILSSWPEDAVEGSFRSKIALLSVDLLTQLTWPIEQDTETATLARYLHVPALQKAQASYKAAVLQHPTTQILRTVVRVCLPALAQAREDRSPTEESIIKVVLYFFRNVALISQPADSAVDEVESGIDRSSTIDQFHYQDIFNLILTICSSMIDDFQTHDVEVLDIIFQLVKGVDVGTLFLDRDEVISARTRELQSLMSTEKGMLASYARYAPSRHNRFGTMLWVQRDGGKKTTLFGQKGAAGNQQLSMTEMDNSKKWKRPKGPKKKDPHPQATANFSPGVELTARAKRHLRTFVEQFLDSSFNPLFLAIRRAIDREEPRVLRQHTRQYLYLISWFLRADRARREKRAADRTQQPSASNDPESFSLIATVLNQETFVLLNRSMQRALDEKNWDELNAGMKCFTQILLTVHDMSESPLDEDQEIAENILNRIFYEQSTHDRIIALLRSYKDQTFDYLDACTELAHVFLRLLERYSKQNVDMQVRSKRRARKKKANISLNDPNDENIDRQNDAEDVAEVQRQASERRFDFNKFAARFISQASVDTFASLLRYYQDLTPEQLKRAHRFFYRVAFKMELTIYLFRMDIIFLFNKLIKGPEGLNLSNPTYKEWQELVQQVLRRLVKRMQDRPALAVELLFSKIPSSIYYLEHGYDKEIPKKTPRSPADLEVKPGKEGDEQIGVAVSILINQSKSDALAWLKDILSTAASDRKAWEEANIALGSIEGSERPETATQSTSQPSGANVDEVTAPRLDLETSAPKAPLIIVKADEAERRTAMHKDKYLRLLLTVIGFERLGWDSEAVETTWIIPSALTSAQLLHVHGLINQIEFAPPSYEDGKSAEDLVRRKAAPRQSHQALNQDDDLGSDSDASESHRFEPGGPTTGPPAERPGRRTLQRQRRSKDDLVDQSVLDARRDARKKLEAERYRKIKSDLFVHDSDDESDEERDRAFFQKERDMREKMKTALAEASNGAGNGEGRATARRATKRKDKYREDMREDSSLLSGGSDEDDRLPAAKRRRSGRQAIDSSDDDSEIVLASGRQTPKSEPRRRRLNGYRHTASNEEASSDNSVASAAETEAETDTPLSSQRPPSGPSSQIMRGVTELQDVEMSTAESNSGSDKENNHSGPMKATVAPARRNVRAGFIIESDSDDE